ncbi:MAG: arsenate reductase [Blastocatellia bacterium]
MEKQITVYEKPTCTTCRKLNKLFAEHCVDWRKVNYFVEAFTEKTLAELIAKTGLRPYDLLRRNEPESKMLGLSPDSPDAEVIAAMVQHPNLIQRPIVEVGSRAVLARPVEKALDILH